MAVVLRDRTPRHAWLALGLFVVSPAAGVRLADHYLVDSVVYAFLAGVLLLLALWARALTPFVIILVGAPALYLVIHRTNWIATAPGGSSHTSPKAT